MTKLGLTYFILKDWDRLVLRYRKVMKAEDAEDCLSNIIMIYLKNPDEVIDNHKAYLDRSMTFQYLNRWRVDKKYVLQSDPEMSEIEFLDLLNKEAPEVEKPDFRLELLVKEVQKLPTKQRKSVMNRLAGNSSKGNTDKANYRHGMLVLRRKLSKMDEFKE